MHLRGEGVPQDYAKARMWAERGAEYGDRESQNVLGVLWRDGLGGRKDVKKAAGYFGVAAGHDHYEGLVNLGKASYGACALAVMCGRAGADTCAHRGAEPPARRPALRRRRAHWRDGRARGVLPARRAPARLVPRPRRARGRRARARDAEREHEHGRGVCERGQLLQGGRGARRVGRRRASAGRGRCVGGGHPARQGARDGPLGARERDGLRARAEQPRVRARPGCVLPRAKTWWG
jgi:hypothetical protein